MAGNGQKDREDEVPEQGLEGPEALPGSSEDGDISEDAPVRAPDEVEDAPSTDVESEAADTEAPAFDETSPAKPAPAGPDKEALRKETEIESLLGPDVHTPVGIPKDYRPMDASLHELFHVEIEDFAGPMDLLLYLIRKHDFDILDIPITEITNHYIELLDTLKAFEIDIAAEFLVLAADLVLIKSKMLLPAKEGIAVDIDEPDIDDDPREELVRRLLEYQKYRDAAEQLKDRDQLGRDVFARVPPDMDNLDDPESGLKSISIFKLVEVMAKLMRRPPSITHSITFESFSITERIKYVLGFGDNEEGRFTLVSLLEGIASRSEVVVTFIAVLEIIKLGLAKIMVEDEEPGLSFPPSEAEPVQQLQDLLPEDEEGTEAEEPDEAPAAGATETDGALEETMRLAKELEALEASMADEAERSRALQEAQKSALEADHEPWEDEPLPLIYIVLTGKKFEGDILDDYR